VDCSNFEPDSCWQYCGKQSQGWIAKRPLAQSASGVTPNQPPLSQQPAAQPGGFSLWGLNKMAVSDRISKCGTRIPSILHHDNDNNKKLGTVKPLDPSDERSHDHPCHKKQWLDLARVLGRLEAREEYAMIHNNDER
jgi:hypothetical protein